jgi:hypothetical protein
MIIQLDEVIIKCFLSNLFERILGIKIRYIKAKSLVMLHLINDSNPKSTLNSLKGRLHLFGIARVWLMRPLMKSLILF